MSLTNIVSKTLTSIILGSLIVAREEQTMVVSDLDIDVLTKYLNFGKFWNVDIP